MSCGRMDRGVIVGGVLICASFLIALLLNRSVQAPAPPLDSRPEGSAETNSAIPLCSQDPSTGIPRVEEGTAHQQIETQARPVPVCR